MQGTVKKYTWGIVDGWPLEAALYLDDHGEPGFLAWLTRASFLRRHVVFAVLSCITVKRPSDFLQCLGGNFANRDWDSLPECPALALALRHAPSADLITAAFGSAPPGFISSFARIGMKPLNNPLSYRALHAIFAAPQNHHRAEAMQHVRRIDSDVIDALDLLDPELICCGLFDIVRDPAGAERFNIAVAFIQSVCSSATNARIRESLQHTKGSFAKWLGRWVERADRFPPLPELTGDRFKPLATAAAMIGAGRRYRNCLATRVPEVLLGNLAFYEWTGAAPGLIVEMRPLNRPGLWAVAELHGYANGFVEHEMRRQAMSDLADAGAVFEVAPGVGSPFAKLLDTYGFDQPDLDDMVAEAERLFAVD